jgi:nitrous oxidase accessory protein NosD
VAYGRLAALLAGALVLACPPGAAAHVVNVHPGPQAIQGAIASAEPGDTLRVHAGTYDENLVVDQRLVIQGARGEARPVIDAGCSRHFAVEVNHGGVVLRRLTVTGADASFESSEVDFEGLGTGTAHNLVVRDGGCGADYGINVFASRAIAVTDNRGTGFDDSGVYIGGIQSTGDGTLLVEGNHLFGNNRGVIVEDTARSADVRVVGNRLNRNDVPPGEGAAAGLFVHNSDGVAIRGNVTDRNGDGTSGYGILIDPTSDRNRLYANVSRHNDAKNLLDENGSSCGGSNSFPISPC